MTQYSRLRARPHPPVTSGKNWFWERLSLAWFHVRQLRFYARESLWFVPTALCVAFVGLGFLTTWIDERNQESASAWTGPIIHSPEAARQVLASIAVALITIAGMVFSITIVTLSVASSQFGPRLLQSFIRRRATQLTLGLFLATAVYSLVILYAMRGEPKDFVPGISTLLGLILMFLSLGALIAYMHDTAMSIQAPNIITEASREIHAVLAQLFPVSERNSAGEEMTSENACPRPDALGRDFATISACFEGYILHIDQESLKVIADQRGATLRLLVREGGFVTPGFPLLDVWPSDLVDDSLRRMALKAFSHGGRPTPYADMEAALNELVQIALRALSPALNDPITAINCVDRLAAALAVVASRPAPAGCLCDDSKRPCVFTRPFTFPELMNIAFSPIRQSGAANPPIMIRTLEGLGLIAATATRRADRNEIRAHADMTLHACERSSWEPFDLEFARKRHACVIQLVTRPTDRPEGASANGDEFAARCRALRGLLSDSGECPRERGTPASD